MPPRVTVATIPPPQPRASFRATCDSCPMSVESEDRTLVDAEAARHPAECPGR